MTEYYWELILKDNSRYEVPPTALELVQRKMKAHDAISLRTATVPYSEIQVFRQTDKVFNSQPLLEDVARAFDEPLIDSETSAVRSRWVKKKVTKRKWDSFYSSSPGYRHLDNDDGMVTVAFKLPVHQIDVNTTPYLSVDELDKLH